MTLIPESVGDLKDKSVLVIWGHSSPNDELQKLILEIKSRNSSHVTLENADRLTSSAHPASTFNVVISNVLEPYPVQHSFDLFSEIVRVLKPSGIFCARENSSDIDKKITNLKLAGLINPSYLKHDSFYEFTARKPDFEVGSSSKLSFAKAAVWSLTDSLVDNDVELINEDELLDESDLMKPNAESLRVCGTTGKRKACKDCSCGLAEELAAEQGIHVASTKPSTSSCGNCYLGDAFRCASCPYLGMPAFKPGEKIQLSEKQLNPDK